MRQFSTLAIIPVLALAAGACTVEESTGFDDPLPSACENVEGFDTCAEASFRGFADDTDGSYTQVDTAAEVPDALIQVIEEGASKGGSYDLMIILDLTGSMSDDLSAVRERVDDIFAAIEANGSGDERVGIFTYRDHCIADEWSSFFDLTGDLEAIRAELDTYSASGGGDTPESVYEAVEETMLAASWSNDNRFAVLIGDAGPHLPSERDPSCTYTNYEEAVAAARAADVTVNMYPILVSAF